MGPEPASRVCPVCGADNGCRQAGSQAAATPAAAAASACWCAGASVDRQVAHAVARAGGAGACLCPRCAAGDVPSPCIDVCQLDASNSYCLGCLRTLEEIGDWAGLDAAGRARVMVRLQKARATSD